MPPYGLTIYAQTLGAVGILGLAGGWALWPFRRDDRPFLWLAAPLAGLATLSLALCLLHFMCRLPVPWCLAVCAPLLCGPTLLLLARQQRLRRGQETTPQLLPRRWPFAAAAVLGVVAWAALASNWTAVQRGEPTASLREGTDAVGYSYFADWALQHPDRLPAYSPDRPGEAFAHILYEGDTRLGAFLLAASAAWVRGTTALFSYDWANGVALACGALGLAGLFASGRRGLLLLLGAAAVSLWFPTSRCGFLGKTLAYPGCLLLAYAFWQAWRRPGGGRLVVAGVLGAGVSLCLHPMVPQAVLLLVLAGATCAMVLVQFRRTAAIGDPATRPRFDFVFLLLVGLVVAAAVLGLPPARHAFARLAYPPVLNALRLDDSRSHYYGLVSMCPMLSLAPGVLLFLNRLRRSARGSQDQRSAYDRLFRGAALYWVMVGPAALYFGFANASYNCPDPPLKWPWLFAIALDLDSPVVPLVGQASVPWLIGAALAVNAVLLLLAVRTRDGEAQSLLLCVGLLPVAWLLDMKHVYEFQGLLFPLTAAGAVLAVERALRRRSPRWIGPLALALGVGFLGLRVPQLVQTFPRYTRGLAHSPHCFVRSEMDTLVRATDGKTVDVALSDVLTTLAVSAEFQAHGVAAHYHEPSWTLMLAWTTWKVPDYPRLGDLLLSDGGPVAPDGVRFHNCQYTLAAGDAVTVESYQSPHGAGLRDEAGRPCFWQGQAPTEVEIRNGGDRPRPALFVADCLPGPGMRYAGRRTVRYALGDRRGEQALTPAEGWKLCIPVEAPPGVSRLRLSVEEPATAWLPGDRRDLLLLISGFRLEPPPGASGAAPPEPTSSAEE